MTRSFLNLEAVVETKDLKDNHVRLMKRFTVERLFEHKSTTSSFAYNPSHG